MLLDGRGPFAAGGRIERVHRTAGEVDTRTGAILATEQLAYRLAKQLAGDVPEGDLHAADGSYGDSAGGAGAASEHGHPGEQGFDVERVCADERTLEIAEHYVLDAESPVGFSVSADAGVSIDAHIGIATGATDDHGFEIGDPDLLFERLRAAA